MKFYVHITNLKYVLYCPIAGRYIKRLVYNFIKRILIQSLRSCIL